MSHKVRVSYAYLFSLSIHFGRCSQSLTKVFKMLSIWTHLYSRFTVPETRKSKLMLYEEFQSMYFDNVYYMPTLT